MDDLVRAELQQEQMTDFHQALFLHVKGLVDMSRHYMIQYYDIWDHNDDVYRGIKRPDKSDTDARNRGEPEKMVVPLTYAQVQTFIAFCESLYTQRERVFELIGTGEEDHKAAKVGEALIDRDLTWNCFPVKLYQFLLDVGRFGMGILKTGWTRETYQQEQQTTMPPLQWMGALLLGKPRTTTSMAEVVRYLGNKIINVSPYSFFPDIRLPLYRYQEGEFLASEDMYSLTQLKQFEKNGDIAGTEWIRPQKADVFALRRRLIRQTERAPMGPGRMATGSAQTTGSAILTEVQVNLVPNMFKINGVPMGPEDYPVKWNIWYVNDVRIVKAEPLGYKHNQFTYSVGEYSPDMLNLVNEGLADSMDRLQDVVSWLINSHITNVRKVIGDKLIVDPSGVEMKDLTERRPVIRLKPDVARQGVDKFVKQLQVVDVTSTHMRDAQELQALVQLTTGINDNALGQYHVGRRSATEARNVNSATAARLKITALMLFRQALEPMARQMLSNHQEGLDTETYVRVLGELSDPGAFMQFKRVTKDDLVGDYDFEVFDGTLPSERSVQAQALQELLIALLGNPAIIMLLKYDPRKLVDEVLTLRGIRNPARFEMDSVRMQELAVQLQLWGLVQQKGQAQQNGPNGKPNNGAAAGPVVPRGTPTVGLPMLGGSIAGGTATPFGVPGGRMVAPQT